MFENPTCIVKAIKPTRTFWKKATILHQKTNRPQGFSSLVNSFDGKIKRVINESAHSEKVARCLGEIFALAEPTECLNPQLPSETIPHFILNNAESTGKNERLLGRNGISPLVELPYSIQPVLSNNAEPTAMVQMNFQRAIHRDLKKSVKHEKRNRQHYPNFHLTR